MQLQYFNIGDADRSDFVVEWEHIVKNVEDTKHQFWLAVLALL